MSVMIGFPSCDYEDLPTWTDLLRWKTRLLTEREPYTIESKQAGL